MNDLKGKVSNIVTLTRKSSTVQANFTKCQSDVGLQPKKLIQDVVTRWNSTYHMFERFLEQRAAITKFVRDHGVSSSLGYFSEQDWDHMQDAITLLGPLHEATEELCSEKSVTSSKVIPICQMLKKIYKRPSEEQNLNMSLTFKEELEKRLHKTMASRLSSYEQVHVLAMATLLDPRFKRKGFMTGEGADLASNR